MSTKISMQDDPMEFEIETPKGSVRFHFYALAGTLEEAGGLDKMKMKHVADAFRKVAEPKEVVSGLEDHHCFCIVVQACEKADDLKNA